MVRSWRHFSIAREHLADHLVRCLFTFLKEDSGIYDLCPPQMLSYDALYPGANKGQSDGVHERGTRLLKLLKQSYAYQIQQRAASQKEVRSEVIGEGAHVTPQDPYHKLNTPASTAEEECKASSSQESVAQPHSNVLAPVDINSFTSSIHGDVVSDPSTAHAANSISNSIHAPITTHTISSGSTQATITNKPAAINYPSVRCLSEDFYDERVPSQLLGVCTRPAVISASSAEGDKGCFPHTHSFACMAFANGDSCGYDISKGTVLCGSDKGTIFEYVYGNTSGSSISGSGSGVLVTPTQVISIPGVSSFEGLQVDAYSPTAAWASQSGSNKRNTNVKIRDISVDAKARVVCVGSSDGTLTMLRRRDGTAEDSGDREELCSYELLARSKVHEVWFDM
jgi:hypothetical protein